MKEVEICFRIDEDVAKSIRNYFNDFFIKKIIEKDTYFFPPHKDFLMTENGKENLRIRESENKNEITYKNVIYNNESYSHAIEKNTNISNVSEMFEILKNLGFRTHITIKKDREIFDNGKFKITIDNVENLGLFAEIEHKGTENESVLLKECMEMAKKLNLERIEKKGYLRLLEERK
ncbi:MAG: class IV adenylate cyclase [Nanoarchaeota archaeon]|nr:class IV adenylate cyclase [Nanoarchaeota archaeon]MBU2520240.1 class IV adenylate cyclase [Nanoarchaeota archaeon]